MPQLLTNLSRVVQERGYEGRYIDAQGYEYESLLAYGQNKAPIAHWRNAQIRRIRSTFDDAYTGWRIKELCRLYDRHGQPLCAGCGTYHATGAVYIPAPAPG